jgi:hypothetical protein
LRQGAIARRKVIRPAGAQKKRPQPFGAAAELPV